MTIFNNTWADFALISVENDHDFEQNEDRAIVIWKWTDFSEEIILSFHYIRRKLLQHLQIQKETIPKHTISEL